MKTIYIFILLTSFCSVAMEKNKNNEKIVPYQLLSYEEKLTFHARNIQVYGTAMQTYIAMHNFNDKDFKANYYEHVKNKFTLNLAEYQALDCKREIEN